MILARAAGLMTLCLAGIAWAATEDPVEERRAARHDAVAVWCEDERDAWQEFLWLDEKVQLELQSGVTVKVLGLTGAEILERWRGMLCPGEGVAREVILARPEDNLAQLLSRFPPRRTFEDYFREGVRCAELRRRAGGIDVCEISNGSRIPPPGSPTR